MTQESILIVEDNQFVRCGLKALLSAEGYNVEVAENAKKAIAKSEKKLFNAALIDIRLPDVDEIELMRQLRESGIKTRMIIMTGFPTLPNVSMH